MCSFDLETTAPEPEVARIVTASIAEVGGGEPTVATDWLADPGVEIPAEAAEVHGVTTEHAREHGRPAGEVVAEVAERLAAARDQRLPVVIFNAPYDMTVMDRECRRHGVPLLGDDVLIVDPLNIDRRLDKFRPSYIDASGRKLPLTPEQAIAAGHVSSRKLEGMCDVYADRFARRTGKPKPTLLVDAHQSAADCLAAARLAWLMGSAATAISYGRPARDGEWERVRGDLPALHEAQRRWALADRPRFEQFKREQAARLRADGALEEADAALAIADRVAIERGWPTLEVMPHEEWAEVAA